MSSHDLSPERREELFVRAVDGCLSASDQRELDAYLAAHPEARDELDDHLEIKSMTDAVVGRILADAKIDPPRPSLAAQRVVDVGLSLLLTGVVLLCAFSLWGFFAAPETPLVLKIGAGLVGGGGLLLFVFVLRSRLRARGRDPYQEIDR